MKINDKLLKPIYEVNYLRAENVDRYRLIIRFFYIEHENMHYWLHKEDIYQEIKQIDGYQDYTAEQCQQDLQSLVDWGNLMAMQDSNKVRTVEDFKNRRYRYQLSEYTVEIERMTIRLEHLHIEGASLEPTVFERIYHNLSEISNVLHKKPVDIHGWLQLLMSDFIRLNQNYQDYIKTLNSAKAEELMKTAQFLIFKDKLITYLRTFVIEMQDKGYLIALRLAEVNNSELKFIFDKATQYELSIPRLDVELHYDEIYENYKEKWHNFYNWFVGIGEVSEMDRLYDITNDIIRKITRYAQQIAEMNNRGSNRKDQYEHVARIFGLCEDINEAHCLSAFVFGVSDCLHFNQIHSKATDNINTLVYSEAPAQLTFDSHSNIVRTKYVRKPAADYHLEKYMYQNELNEQLKRKQEALAAIIINNEIDFEKLPQIDASTRKTLLTWLSRALGQTSLTAKTEEGHLYSIDQSQASRNCLVQCEDGNFIMPVFKIKFEE